MKKLPSAFRKDGFDHVVEKRQGDVVLIRKSKPEVYEGFEVALVQSHNGYRFGNELFPPAEFMPRDDDWGYKGFTFADREAAERKFAKLASRDTTVKKIKLKK